MGDLLCSRKRLSEAGGTYSGEVTGKLYLLVRPFISSSLEHTGLFCDLEPWSYRVYRVTSWQNTGFPCPEAHLSWGVFCAFSHSTWGPNLNSTLNYFNLSLIIHTGLLAFGS